MRHSEFWTRMEAALGASYAQVWSREQVIEGLGGRTVAQAFDEGEDAKTVWRAVWKALELPPRER
ncbi:MAG: DUF3046 domain-containing protein [Nocardioidaceae bacterium]